MLCRSNFSQNQLHRLHGVPTLRQQELPVRRTAFRISVDQIPVLRFCLVVTSLGASTKLLHVEPGSGHFKRILLVGQWWGKLDWDVVG